MASRTTPKHSWLRALLIGAGSLAAAAALGALVASALPADGLRLKSSVQNPFDSRRSSL